MTVVFFVWPAEQFAAQIITTAYGIPLGDLIQIAVTKPHLSDHGRARGRQMMFVGEGEGLAYTKVELRR